MSKIRKLDDDWLEYSKDYMKIKFSSDDNLPLNKPLKFYQITVTIRCVIWSNTLKQFVNPLVGLALKRLMQVSM